MPRLADNAIEFGIFAVVVGLVIVLGFIAVRWRRPPSMPRGMQGLDQWGLGGRAFGPVVTFFLLGGDIYTAYTLVAIPALVYGQGAMGFFAVAFATIQFPIALVTLLRLWSVAHVHGFVTPAEFVRARFGSRTLATAVAVAAILATMPYIALQLIGVEVVFKAMGMDGRLPLIVAFGLLAICTFNSGLRAPALMSVVKDSLILVTVVLVLITLARSHLAWSGVFRLGSQRLATQRGSGLLLTPANELNYVTLAFGSALALFLYPHVLTGVLATRSRSTIKRAFTMMPAYTFALGLMALLGFAAIALALKPIGGDANTVVPRLLRTLLSDWGSGIGYAAIGVGALVPAAIMSIAAANLFTRNIYREFIRPSATQAQETRVSRQASLTVKLGAMAAVLFLTPQFSVDLQLMGGVVILQILPAVAIGLYTAWFHRWALVAGLVTGLFAGLVMLYQVPKLGPGGIVERPHFGGSSWPLAHLGLHTSITIYAGLIALAVNFVVVIGGTLALRRLKVPYGADITRPWQYTVDEDDISVQRIPGLVDGRPKYVGKHSLT